MQTVLGTTALAPLPNGVTDVRLDGAGVEVELVGGTRSPGGEEESASSAVVERLEALRRGLRGRYEFVAALALPHR